MRNDEKTRQAEGRGTMPKFTVAEGTHMPQTEKPLVRRPI